MGNSFYSTSVSIQSTPTGDILTAAPYNVQTGEQTNILTSVYCYIMGNTISSPSLDIKFTTIVDILTATVYNVQTGEPNDTLASVYYVISCAFLWYRNGEFYLETTLNISDTDPSKNYLFQNSIKINKGDSYSLKFFYNVNYVIINKTPLISSEVYVINENINYNLILTSDLQKSGGNFGNLTVNGNIASGIIINAKVDYSTFPLTFSGTRDSSITLISADSNLTIVGEMGGMSELFGNIFGTFNNGSTNVLSGGNINIPFSQRLIIGEKGIMNNLHSTLYIDGTLSVAGTFSNGTINSNGQSGTSFENLAGNIIAFGTIEINRIMNNYGNIYLPGGYYTNNGTTTQSGIFYISNSQNPTNNIFVNNGKFNVYGPVILNNYNTSVQGGGIAYITSVENNGGSPLQNITTNVNNGIISVYSPGTFYINSATMENRGEMGFIPSDISTTASLIIGALGIMINFGTIKFSNLIVNGVTEYSVFASLTSGSRYYNGPFGKITFANQSEQVQYGAGGPDGKVPLDIFYSLNITKAIGLNITPYSIPTIPPINQPLFAINNNDVYLLSYNTISAVNPDLSLKMTFCHMVIMLSVWILYKIISLFNGIK